MRLLVTGASGFLGSNLCIHFAAQGHEVWGAWGSREPGFSGVQSRQADVHDPASVASLLDAARPDAVIHAAALADPDACALDPAAAMRTNRDGTRHLACACAARGVKLVYTSTYLVFDGSKPFSREEDPPAPLGAYARSKAEGEREALACPAARPLVARMALMYGWGRGAAKGRNFSELWLRAFLTGNKVRAFTDQFRSTLWVGDACLALEKALAAGAEGLLHVAGPDRVSRHAFALALAAEFGFPAGSVDAASLKDAAFRDPRPADASLSIERFKALTAFTPLGVEAGLKAMHDALEKL